MRLVEDTIQSIEIAIKYTARAVIISPGVLRPNHSLITQTLFKRDETKYQKQTTQHSNEAQD